MSNHTRRQKRQPLANDAAIAYSKIEQELVQGYLEVEITGLTFRRLVTAYLVLVRGAWSYTLDGVRSLLRPTPAL